MMQSPENKHDRPQYKKMKSVFFVLVRNHPPDKNSGELVNLIEREHVAYAPRATAPANPTRPRRPPHEAEAPRAAAPLDEVEVDVAEVLKVEMMSEVIDSEVVVLVTTVPVDVEEPRVEVLFFVRLAELVCEVVLPVAVVAPVLTLVAVSVDECGLSKMVNDVLLARTLLTLSTATKATK